MIHYDEYGNLVEDTRSEREKAQAEEKSVHGAEHVFALYGMEPVYHLTHGGHEFVEDEWQFILDRLVHQA